MNGQKLVDEKDISKEIKVIIKCPERYQNIAQCVQLVNECTSGPAEIKCEGKKKTTGKSSIFLVFVLPLLAFLLNSLTKG